jgi:hypothetical protein
MKVRKPSHFCFSRNQAASRVWLARPPAAGKDIDGRSIRGCAMRLVMQPKGAMMGHHLKGKEEQAVEESGKLMS